MSLKFCMTIVDLTQWRGSPVYEAQRTAVLNRFIAEHTYVTDDADDLPSSGEIFDDIDNFIRRSEFYPCDAVYQSYDDYDWVVLKDNRVQVHLYLHLVEGFDDDTPQAAFDAVMNRSVDQ